MSNNHLTDIKFSDLPKIDPKLVKVLEEHGFEFASTIQKELLSLSLADKDIVCKLPSGSGKTVFFLIEVFNHILKNKAMETPVVGAQAVIFIKDEERIQEIYTLFVSFCKSLHSNIRVSLFNEASVADTTTISKCKNSDILIGSIEHISGYTHTLHQSNMLDFINIGVVIVDEAENFANMKDIRDLRFCLRRSSNPKDRKNFIFTSIIDSNIKTLSYEFLNLPQFIETTAEDNTFIINNIEEEIIDVSEYAKIELLLTLIEEDWPESALIFAKDNDECVKISQSLMAAGHRVAFYKAGLKVEQRNFFLNKMNTAPLLDILVTTDDAILKVKSVSHVYSYHLPDNIEDYLNRISHTGRSGNLGKVIHLASDEELEHRPKLLQAMQKGVKRYSYDISNLLPLPKLQDTE